MLVTEIQRRFSDCPRPCCPINVRSLLTSSSWFNSAVSLLPQPLLARALLTSLKVQHCAVGGSNVLNLALEARFLAQSTTTMSPGYFQGDALFFAVEVHLRKMTPAALS